MSAVKTKGAVIIGVSTVSEGKLFKEIRYLNKNEENVLQKDIFLNEICKGLNFGLSNDFSTMLIGCLELASF